MLNNGYADMDDKEYEKIRNIVAEKIAGEVTLSQNPGKTIKKWRNSFGITQVQLSNELELSPSVISDYESGRRSSPGTNMIKRMVEAMLSIDSKNGGKNIRNYGRILRTGIDFSAVLDIAEYDSPVTCKEFCRYIGAEFVESIDGFNSKIFGHTAIKSLKAILEFSHGEFQQIYGWSTERALIFTDVTTGKSPMVAIRVTNLKPGMVVLHGIEEANPVARKIARIERIPLAVTTENLDDVITTLSERGG